MTHISYKQKNFSIIIMRKRRLFNPFFGPILPENNEKSNLILVTILFYFLHDVQEPQRKPIPKVKLECFNERRMRNSVTMLQQISFKVT